MPKLALHTFRPGNEARCRDAVEYVTAPCELRGSVVTAVETSGSLSFISAASDHLRPMRMQGWLGLTVSLCKPRVTHGNMHVIVLSCTHLQKNIYVSM